MGIREQSEALTDDLGLLEEAFNASKTESNGFINMYIFNQLFCYYTRRDFCHNYIECFRIENKLFDKMMKNFESLIRNLKILEVINVEDNDDSFNRLNKVLSFKNVNIIEKSNIDDLLDGYKNSFRHGEIYDSYGNLYNLDALGKNGYKYRFKDKDGVISDKLYDDNLSDYY